MVRIKPNIIIVEAPNIPNIHLTVLISDRNECISIFTSFTSALVATLSSIEFIISTITSAFSLLFPVEISLSTALCVSITI